jgi:hypothetical protein
MNNLVRKKERDREGGQIIQVWNDFFFGKKFAQLQQQHISSSTLHSMGGKVFALVVQSLQQQQSLLKNSKWMFGH